MKKLHSKILKITNFQFITSKHREIVNLIAIDKYLPK